MAGGAAKMAAKAGKDMTVEMYCVVLCIAMFIAFILLHVVWEVLTGNFFNLAGNRANYQRSGISLRKDRAINNLHAALIMFIPLVFVLDSMDVHNKTTELACKVFVGLRVLYHSLYVLGIPLFRSLAWLCSLVCILILLLQALKSKHVEVDQMMPVIDGHLDFLRAKAKEHLKVEL